MVRRDGLDQLSARRVANELGASTAPVYSNFATMAELAVAAKQAAVRELLALTRRDHTGNAFLNMGVGVLTFAWAWPRLYADLFLAPAADYDPGPDLMEELVGVMAELPELEPLPLDERIVVLKKLAIFTHGLATEICHGCQERCELETLVVLLREVGRAVVADARQGHPRSAGDAELLADLWTDEGPAGPASGPSEGET